MSHSINFLEEHEPVPVVRHRRSSRKYFKYFAVVLIAAICLLFIWTSIEAGRVIAAGLDGKESLEEARDAALELDFDTAEEKLLEAKGYFSDAESALSGMAYMKIFPWVGDQLRATDTLVKVGQDTIDALIDVVALGGDMLRLSGIAEEDIRALTEGVGSAAVTFDDLSTETKRAILQRFAGSSSDLTVTEAKINIALDELNSLDKSGVVGPIASALDPLKEQLEDFKETIHTLSIFAVMLPEFGGLDEEKTFLVLFLNNTEIRPGGGFIGSYGVLGMKDGDITELNTRDVYHLDDAADPNFEATPPKPITAWLGLNKWYFRDSNWSPDFAVSSQTGIGLFQQEVAVLTPEQQQSIQPPATIDGVIGLTPTFAADILEITGPIVIGGQEFNADNIPDTIEYQVEFGFKEDGVPAAQRKELLSDLVNEMKLRLFSLPLSEWQKVVDAVEENLRTKQIVMYSHDAEIQEVMTSMGWAGRVLPQENDSLFVVDANMASLKSDPDVKRTINYIIQPTSDGEFMATVRIDYNHTGTFDWNTSRYRTYTRIYVPEGSEFVRSEGSLRNDKFFDPSGSPGYVDQTTDLGFTVFGTFTSIEPGTTRSLTFEYLLPESVKEMIEDGKYKLNVLKQIGAEPHALTLDLDFDKNVKTASVSEMTEEWGDDRYRLNTEIDQDKFFEVGL